MGSRRRRIFTGSRSVAATLAALAVSLAAPLAAEPLPGAAGPGSEGPPARIHLGMWTRHVFRPGQAWDDNRLIGVSAKGFFGGTFINSYGDRAVAAGIQRLRPVARIGNAVSSVGGRLGVVTGYDERFIALAGKTPMLPMGQALAMIDHGRFGAEMAYAGLTLSIALNGRF